MLKPSVFNILLFWLIKYMLFYVLQMFRSGNYALIQFGELQTGEDWFYYLWIFLFMPVVCMLMLTAPIYFSFKDKKPNVQYLMLITVLVVEYLIYTYLASPADYWNGVYNALIGIMTFVLFFHRFLFTTKRANL